MADAIQEYLTSFHSTGDRRALALAFSAMRQEFVGPVARYLREAPTAPRVEQVLSDLLVDLLGVSGAGAPRAMAPPQHPKPDAWRRCVLLNALRDMSRREKRQQALAERQTANLDDGSAAASAVEMQIEHRQQRQRIIALLPRLGIRRRAAIVIELGMEMPMVWIEELANDLGMSWHDLFARLRHHEEQPFDEERKVRVLYGPEQPTQTARDAYRQVVSRACTELRTLLERGRP